MNASEVSNLIITVVLCMAIMIGWQAIENKYSSGNTVVMSKEEISEQDNFQSKESVIDSTSSMRIPINNNKLLGSVLLIGARLDDLILKDYRVSTKENSENITLLSPTQTMNSYFTEFGWIDPNNVLKVPNKTTIWTADKSYLANNDTITLTWNNENGLIFKIRISLDDKYMFTIEQEVHNTTNLEVKLIPYGRINRSHDLDSSPWISHEGAISIINEQLKEWTYKKLINPQIIKVTKDKGDSNPKSWIGFADKYWVTALIPNNFHNSKLVFRAKYANNLNNIPRFQIDFSEYGQAIKPLSTSSTAHYFFAGAKELKLLDYYSEKLNISLFDKAVDFGVLYFMTKPLLMILEYFYSIIKNFGLSIILLTVLMKIVTLPLSNRAYISGFKIRSIQPQILKIKQLYKNDKIKMSKELSLLFKKNDTNPLSGIVPMIVQIPLFFTLYKVLFITIEMRHSPFYLWIKDLSAPDPANFLTLFGILKFHTNICIGVLPVILGITIMIQQKLNSSKDLQKDQTQATFLKFMPYVLIFIFSSFPAGLVIYWICNNTLTIIQQLLIKFYILKKLKIAYVNCVDEKP